MGSRRGAQNKTSNSPLSELRPARSSRTVGIGMVLTGLLAGCTGEIVCCPLALAVTGGWRWGQTQTHVMKPYGTSYNTALVIPFTFVVLGSLTCCCRSSRPLRHERPRAPPEVELSPGDCLLPSMDCR
ncbi:hypothetical protein B0T21DRAFT_363917 [Apiosordaria backusii]|uniref:Uncharacterized protein n=1 Tax=Apiosordaria backusii TaxID=314023 RepID=A0AA40BMB0_9PEZI|nr:hypothetical protein B0T21DRAFT_363917 [Apiosordaria backusii]